MSARATIAVLLLTAPATAAPPEVLNPTVVSTRPHDTSCYTQGLLLHDGLLYESCGGYGGYYYGPSGLREVNPATGVVIRSSPLPNPSDDYFAEGLARIGNRLIQLTWQENVAFVWDIDTFTVVDQFGYTGPGWGLCYDGTRLVMSNGSSHLTFRDPTDFHVLGTLDVTIENPPGTVTARDSLNELECVGGSIFANVYTTDEIVEIDASTGEVVRRIQAPDLLTAQEAVSADVLNGIAYDAATGNFLITGKLWPKLFETRFGAGIVPDGGPNGDPNAPGDPAPAGDPGKPPTAGKSKKGCSAAAPWPLAALLPFARRRKTRR